MELSAINRFGRIGQIGQTKKLSPAAAYGQGRTRTDNAGSVMKRIEFIVFISLLGLINLPLLNGQVSEGLIFSPHEVYSGQWWRLITFPFVHISWYHLILDGLAFWLLWSGFRETGLLNKIMYALVPGFTSLLLPVMASRDVYQMGLCGLSGIAHGLTAITALEMMRDEERDGLPGRAGLLLFAGIVGKCIYELITGNVLFHSLHLGNVGTPIVEAHAGGVIGGLIVFHALSSRIASRGSYLRAN